MIQVYNTMTRRKEIFKPLKKNEISIYCCGITPNKETHIGNARPFVVWDVIRRYFEKLGYKVRYIQNFTDVDDKIIAAANLENSTWQEVSARNIKIYFKAMDALNVRRADFYPKVSETMTEIISMIETLIEKGYAYRLENGDVYYSVEKDEGYGKLSGRKVEELLAGARVEVDGRKHHPMDFALWKAAKEGEPFWPSPFGNGRPGWHIECSAMSLKYLGEKFDFHGGGADLIFPHHENEIAQSQAAIGDDHSFAQYWLHNGFLTRNNQKMSSSAGNFFTVEEILQKFPGEVVRLFLLQTHYRNPIDFADTIIEDTRTAYNRLKTSYEYLNELAKKIEDGNFVKTAPEKSAMLTVSQAGGLVELAERLMSSFEDAMNDDFNTALAISYMFELSRDVNAYYNDYIGGKIFPRGTDAFIIMRVREVFMDMAEIIGIFENIEDETADNELVDKLMNIILSIRQDARANKNWATADKIRDELKTAGIVLEDTPQGVKWKRA